MRDGLKGPCLWILTMLLILLTAVTGCSSSADPAKTSSVPPESEPVTEVAAEDNLIIPTYNCACYYGGLLYYLNQPLGAAPARIYYIDPETGENGILCGKPDCMHDSEDCGACINSNGHGFTIYQDKIYWYTKSVSDKKLMCEDLDGTNRREIMSLDKEFEWFVTDKSFIGIYNDTLYRCGDGPAVKEGEPSDNMLLYCQPLQKGSEPKELYSVQNVYSEAARIYGNQLYFAVVGADNDLSICVCDLDSGEIKELFHKDQADNTPLDIAVHDNKLILHGFGTCVSIYSLEGDSYTVIGEEGHNYQWATETKIFEVVSRTEYRLLELNGALITEGNVDIPGLRDDFLMWQCLGSIKDKMLFLYTYLAESAVVSGSAWHNYIVSFDTDTLEWKILWDGVSDYE